MCTCVEHHRVAIARKHGVRRTKCGLFELQTYPQHWQDLYIVGRGLNSNEGVHLMGLSSRELFLQS
jgi:hypothetical protein